MLLYLIMLPRYLMIFYPSSSKTAVLMLLPNLFLMSQIHQKRRQQEDRKRYTERGTLQNCKPKSFMKCSLALFKTN